MKRTIILAALVVLLAVGIALARLIPRGSADAVEPAAQSITQTTRNVKVPNIIRDTEASAAPTETGQTGVGQNIQSGNVQSGYTLPASGQPKDTPPDDSGKTGNTTK